MGALFTASGLWLSRNQNVIAENTTSLTVTHGRKYKRRVVGTTPQYPEVRNFKVDMGRFFNQKELNNAEE